MQQAKEQIGSGLPALETRAAQYAPAEVVRQEVERQPYDLVILDAPPQGDADLAEHILQVGRHHLLLVPRPQPTLARALICVAAGEPGKEDVLFAGRLLRHLGAEATLLSVLPKGGDHAEAHSRAERFLTAGVRTLGVLGVPARTTIRSGAVRAEIIAEMTAGGYDLLVLGAPLPGASGRGMLAGVVGELLSSATNHPVLIVRAPEAAGRARWVGPNGRIQIDEEVIR